MDNIEIIISKILNTAPYQLPPVVHTSGVYHIDVVYRGVGFNIVSPQKEHAMERYLCFCVEQNDRIRFTSKDFDKLPTPYGSVIPVRYQQDHKPFTT